MLTYASTSPTLVTHQKEIEMNGPGSTRRRMARFNARLAQARTVAANPTRHEDAVLDAFNHAIKALNTRRLGRDVARAEMPELGLVIFPGLDASVTIDDSAADENGPIFEATIGPDAEVVYTGSLPGSAVAMIIARFANEMALQAIESM